MRMLFILACLLLCLSTHAQVKDSIKVLFIYGSKPVHGYEHVEPRWFGGMRGGHVAIQIGADKVLSFRSTEYPCHVFSKGKKEKFASVFEYRTVRGAWETFPPHNYIIDSLQRAEVVIPIDSIQRARIDSLAAAYTTQVPYDYAIFGIRCASASYKVLQKAGIAPMHKHANWLRIFTVRALRKRLFKQAEKNKNNGWKKRIYKGGTSRKWERDIKD
ncbi:MAG TPA: hypothetical protein VG738_09260 [Chitinophagaceae bacterium]|nr:hypothetical protein [Chitinophagaceae bacterium]